MMPPPTPVRLGEVAWDVVTGDPPEYIPTGLSALDDLISGATSGELMVIAGSPGQGKTSLAMQIAEAAAEMGIPVGVFSLEMSPEALSVRQLSAHSGVHMSRLLRRRFHPLSEEEVQRVTLAADKLKRYPIFVDPRSGLHGETVYTTSTEWVSQGIRLIILDYLQLMEGDAGSRQETVGRNARDLKRVARDFNVPVIALSQVNRGAGFREDKVPRMSDLRDSGQVEQVADKILMFHYPQDGDLREATRECQIHVVKQRQGPVGYATVTFDKTKTRFKDIAATGEAQGHTPKWGGS
jgi:replicative DNA helicase